MHRSLFLLLISVLVLSAAVALPASLEESLDSELALRAESVEKVDINEAAKDSVSSSEEQKDEVKEKVDSSSDSASSEEEKQSEKIAPSSEDSSMEAPARRVRSAEEVKSRNLYLLATICPQKDFKPLEESPVLRVKIEIKDMYGVCAELKNRQ